MNTGGYSAAARELNRRFRGRWVRRQQIDSWDRRRTLNMAGEPFPGAVAVNPDAKATEPHRLFDLDAVADWYAAGVPGPYGQGWRVPELRGTPLTG